MTNPKGNDFKAKATAAAEQLKGKAEEIANNPKVTNADREAFKKAWGLDQPIPVQYCRWIGACNPDVSGTVLGIFPPPAALLGPTGWPNFLPNAISGAGTLPLTPTARKTPSSASTCEL